MFSVPPSTPLPRQIDGRSSWPAVMGHVFAHYHAPSREMSVQSNSVQYSEKKLSWSKRDGGRRSQYHQLRLFELVQLREDLVVLLGIKPDRAETEYGWIEPVASHLAGKPDGLSWVRR